MLIISEPFKTNDDLAGRKRPRAGRRRHAARRSPEAVRQALNAAMSMYSLSSCKLFWDAALDTKCLLAWSQDTAVLAFRGTASFTNACSDLKVSLRHPMRMDDSNDMRCRCNQLVARCALLLGATELTAHKHLTVSRTPVLACHWPD